MTAKEMIADLLRCFSPPPAAMQEKMERLADTIPETGRQDVIDKIIESKDASRKLSAKDIVEACVALGVSYRATHYLPVDDWVCDACGRAFKYHPSPSEDDKIDKYIYDFCPDCGLQPYYTKMAQEYNALGIATPWYADMVKRARRWGKGTQSHPVKTRMGGQWNVGGFFWNIDAARQERKEQKQIEINAKMATIDSAKRWDLQTS